MMPAFVKLIQGSFHQGNERFGSTAGKQCTWCALFSLTLSVVKNPGSWDKRDIDYIVESGDQNYKEFKCDDLLMFSDLPQENNIKDWFFSIKFLDDPKSKLVNCNSVAWTIFDKKIDPQADGFLMIIDEKCISVMWNKRNFFLFDSHSRDNHLVRKFRSKIYIMFY